MMRAVEIAVSGLLAGLKKLDNSANNIANADSAGALDDPANLPYTPLTVQQRQVFDGKGEAFGVRSESIPKNQPFLPSYAPDSPFANEGGFIGVPNVSMTEEAFNIMSARQQILVNTAVIKAANELSEKVIKSFNKRV